MANEFRSQSQMGGRVDYQKKKGPDLVGRAKIDRAKTGGSVPGSQPPSPNKAKQSAPKPVKSFDFGKLATKPSMKDTHKVADRLMEDE